MKLPKIVRHGNKYRAQFTKEGVRYTITKDTYEECEKYLICKLYDINLDETKVSEPVKSTPILKEIITQYYNTVGCKKKTAKQLFYLFRKFNDEFTWLVSKQIHEVTPQDLNKWKHLRLKKVQPSSVNREMSAISPVFTYAMEELYLIDENPFSKVSRPKSPEARHRRISEAEIERLLIVANYTPKVLPRTIEQWVAWVFLFALATCMRRGEILGLTRDCVFPSHIFLADTKNGTSRNVPLNDEASELLSVLPLDSLNPMDRVIPVENGSFRAVWHRLQKRALLTDLHFHDTRHEAISRFVHKYKMPVETLAKITGHKDLCVLLNTYYNPTVDEMLEMMK